MKKILIVTFFACFVYSEDKIKYSDDSNKGNFLENISSDDPKVQAQLDKLKNQFEAERTTINRYYKQKHEVLKKQKKIRKWKIISYLRCLTYPP